MLNYMEKKYVEMGCPANSVQKVWDRNTNNGQNPEAMTLQQAKAVVNDYMKELGFSDNLLRK